MNKTVALIISTFSLLAISIPVLAQVGVGYRGSNGYYYINKLYSGKLYNVNLNGMPLVRNRISNKCGILEFKPSTNELSQLSKIEIVDGKTQQTYGFDFKNLTAKETPTCTGQVVTEHAVWLSSKGYIGVSGLTPSSNEKIRFLSATSYRNLKANRCGFLSFQLDTVVPNAFIVNGMAYPTNGTPGQAIYCNKGTLYMAYPPPTPIAPVDATTYTQANPLPQTFSANTVVLTSSGSSTTTSTSTTSATTSTSGGTTGNTNTTGTITTSSSGGSGTTSTGTSGGTTSSSSGTSGSSATSGSSGAATSGSASSGGSSTSSSGTSGSSGGSASSSSSGSGAATSTGGSSSGGGTTSGGGTSSSGSSASSSGGAATGGGSSSSSSSGSSSGGAATSGSASSGGSSGSGSGGSSGSSGGTTASRPQPPAGQKMCKSGTKLISIVPKANTKYYAATEEDQSYEEENSDSTGYIVFNNINFTDTSNNGGLSDIEIGEIDLTKPSWSNRKPLGGGWTTNISALKPCQ